MTDEQAMELGKRWMECLKDTQFPFGARLLPDKHGRVYRTYGSVDEFGFVRLGLIQESGRVLRTSVQHRDLWIPDLRDPATMGCLLSQVLGMSPRMTVETGRNIAGSNAPLSVSVEWGTFIGECLEACLIAALEAVV